MNLDLNTVLVAAGSIISAIAASWYIVTGPLFARILAHIAAELPPKTTPVTIVFGTDDQARALKLRQVLVDRGLRSVRIASADEVASGAVVLVAGPGLDTIAYSAFAGLHQGVIYTKGKVDFPPGEEWTAANNNLTLYMQVRNLIEYQRSQA